MLDLLRNALGAADLDPRRSHPHPVPSVAFRAVRLDSQQTERLVRSGGVGSRAEEARLAEDLRGGRGCDRRGRGRGPRRFPAPLASPSFSRARESPGDRRESRRRSHSPRRRDRCSADASTRRYPCGRLRATTNGRFFERLVDSVDREMLSKASGEPTTPCQSHRCTVVRNAIRRPQKRTCAPPVHVQHSAPGSAARARRPDPPRFGSSQSGRPVAFSGARRSIDLGDSASRPHHSRRPARCRPRVWRTSFARSHWGHDGTVSRSSSASRAICGERRGVRRDDGEGIGVVHRSAGYGTTGSVRRDRRKGGSTSSGPLLSARFTIVETGHTGCPQSGKSGLQQRIERRRFCCSARRATCPMPSRAASPACGRIGSIVVLMRS